MERYFELCEETPFSDEVQKQYNPSNERIQHANYKMDLEIAKLKRSLWITQALGRRPHRTFPWMWQQYLVSSCLWRIGIGFGYPFVWYGFSFLISWVLPFASVAIRFRATPCWVRYWDTACARRKDNFKLYCSFACWLVNPYSVKV